MQAVEGIYENGIVHLEKKLNVLPKTKVMVIFEDMPIEDPFEEVKKPLIKLRGAWKTVSEADKKEINTHFDNIRNEWERDI